MTREAIVLCLSCLLLGGSVQIGYAQDVESEAVAAKTWETTLTAKLDIKPAAGLPGEVVTEGSRKLKSKAEKSGFPMQAGQKVTITQRDGKEDVTEFYICLWDPITGKQICVIFTRPW